MTTTELLIVAIVIALAVVIALVVIYFMQQQDEADLLSEGYVIYFSKEDKKFEEWPVVYFNKHVILDMNDWTFISKSFNSEIDNLNKFLEREKYHVSTGKQAINTFDEYLESKLYE